MKHLHAFLNESLEATAKTNCLALPELESRFAPVLEYLSLLSSWSEKVDLVAGAAPEVLIQRHVCDAFACWALLRQRGFLAGGGVLDVGSGGGLPGALFAILSPEEPVILCEPREQRTIFLKEARRRLGLKNIRVVQKRIETMNDSDGSPVALAVFRALRPEAEIFRAVRSRLSPGGSVAFLSGANVPPPAEFERAEVLSYAVPTDTEGRNIYLIKADA